MAALSPHLKGGSLIYAVMISLLVAMLVGGGVLLQHYQTSIQNQLYHQELAWEGAESVAVWTFAQNEPSDLSQSGSLWRKADSFQVESFPWGLYGCLQIRSQYGEAIVDRQALWGAKPSGILQASLFVKDQNRSIRLVGKTRLQGLCYLPTGRASSGQINNRRFEGKNLVQGQVANSRYKSPNLSYDNFVEVRKLLNSLPEDSLSAISWGKLTQDSILGPWREETNLLRFHDAIRLQDNYLSGRSILISEQAISIGRECKINEVLLIAPSIIVEAGFEGSLQLFARDSVIIEPEVYLKYPSAIVVAGRDQNNPGKLVVRENAKVEGTLINDPAFGERAFIQNNFTLFEKGSEIWGHAIIKGILDHYGMVRGTLIAERFRVKTRSGTYVNHLLDAEISQIDFSDDYVAGLYVEDPEQYQIIKWLD